MDALKSFMLYIEQLGVALAPIFTQGTTALDPLVRGNPWIFLIGAFILGMAALTAFRIFSGMLARLLMLPVILIMVYVLFISGSRIFSLIVPLVQDKLSGT